MPPCLQLPVWLGAPPTPLAQGNGEGDGLSLASLDLGLAAEWPCCRRAVTFLTAAMLL